MNTICTVRKDKLGWIVEAVTPEGTRVIATSGGTSWDAIKKALWAEPEPA